jgi:hypothetical protein
MCLQLKIDKYSASKLQLKETVPEESANQRTLCQLSETWKRELPESERVFRSE